jgi:hypothetical protein
MLPDIKLVPGIVPTTSATPEITPFDDMDMPMAFSVTTPLAMRLQIRTRMRGSRAVKKIQTPKTCV